MGLLDNLTQGTTVQVELAGLPPFSIDLGGSGGGVGSAIGSALRPRISVLRNGQLLVEPIQPFGSPDDGFPWGLLLVAAVGILLVVAVAWAVS